MILIERDVESLNVVSIEHLGCVDIDILLLDVVEFERKAVPLSVGIVRFAVLSNGREEFDRINQFALTRKGRFDLVLSEHCTDP